MVALQPIFKKAYWSLVAFGAIYGVGLLSLTLKPVQRHMLYLHKASTEYWHNLDNPTTLGFAKNQITPFYLDTADGEQLYGWHILPIGLYANHEDSLTYGEYAQSWPPATFKDSLAFKLLTEDPEARVVINFHGNAGHVGQGYRPSTYKSLTSASSKIHILTVDYRGFGRSSGVPSEAGLIVDGVSLVRYVMDLGIPPSRIVLLGQSLGTQVASAVALHFADPAASLNLIPGIEHNVGAVLQSSQQADKPITFASVILAASFPSLPRLLKVYRLSGLIPLLSPLRVYPSIQDFLLKRVVERWETSTRLAALTASAAKNSPGLNLQIMHAANDYDISWRMGLENFRACADAVKNVTYPDRGWENVRFEDKEERGEDGEWTGETIRKSIEYKDVKVEWTLLMSGGHNRIVADVPVALAVLKGFGL